MRRGVFRTERRIELLCGFNTAALKTGGILLGA